MHLLRLGFAEEMSVAQENAKRLGVVQTVTIADYVNHFRRVKVG